MIYILKNELKMFAKATVSPRLGHLLRTFPIPRLQSYDQFKSFKKEGFFSVNLHGELTISFGGSYQCLASQKSRGSYIKLSSVLLNTYLVLFRNRK